jgi:hypothetical protein
VAQQLGVCPVTSSDGAPLVAVADPSEERFAAAREALGGECTFVVTTPSALAQLIEELPAASHGPTAVNLAEAPAPEAPPVLSAAEVEPEAEAQPEVEHAPAVPAPAPVRLAAPDLDDDASPVLDQLDRLLDRLVSERVSTADELAGYRRQLDELAADKARLEEGLRAVEESLRSVEESVRKTEESVRSLEAKLGQEDELLDSMRTKLAGLAQPSGQS